MATQLFLSGVLYPDGSVRQTAPAYNFRQRAIFGYGFLQNAATNLTNLVSNTGAVALDTTGVGTSRYYLAACSYGGDKAIFGFGHTSGLEIGERAINLVSNVGVVVSENFSPTETATYLAACGYGGDKGVFIGGSGQTTNRSWVHYVSNVGVVTSTAGILGGNGRRFHSAAGYGGDKGIFGFGSEAAGTYNNLTTTQLITNTGTFGGQRTHAGYNNKNGGAGASYGVDKALFGFGNNGSAYVTTKTTISNTGDLLGESSTVGTARGSLAASGYGGDKAIFGFGTTGGGTYLNITNLVSRIGVVIADSSGVGTARFGLAASGYGA